MGKAGNPVKTAFREIQKDLTLGGEAQGMKVCRRSFFIILKYFWRQMGKVPGPERAGVHGLTAGTGEIIGEGIVKPQEFAWANQVGMAIEHPAQEGGPTMGMAQNKDQIVFLKLTHLLPLGYPYNLCKTTIFKSYTAFQGKQG